MADPMSERHWLAIKRYVTNVRATYRDLRYAGRPMQHLVPLWDEAERLRAALDETTAARDGDLVRQLAEAWRERDAARAEVKRLLTELDQVRRAGEEELEYAAQRYAMADAMRGDACIERDRLAEQVKRVREQHSARRIYGECGHRHEKPDADLGVKEVRSVGLVCEDGYDYTVCRACCCDPDGDQSRECAENHDRECWPCPTIRVLDGSEAGQ